MLRLVIWALTEQAMSFYMADKGQFTTGDIFLRFGFALLLTLVTFNPSGWSFIHWMLGSAISVQLPLKVLSALLLIICWAIYLKATWASLGAVGTMLVAALFAALVWVLIDWGLLNANSQSVFIWIAEIILAATLGIGMSWSHIQRRLSGQYDIDDVEN